MLKILKSKRKSMNIGKNKLRKLIMSTHLARGYQLVTFNKLSKLVKKILKLGTKYLRLNKNSKWFMTLMEGHWGSN
jgi:hypothetical protein